MSKAHFRKVHLCLSPVATWKEPDGDVVWPYLFQRLMTMEDFPFGD